MNDRPAGVEIFRCEQEIERLLAHHIKRYKYVGEAGKEFEVIQSLFSAIDELAGLSNKQIRWYAVIISLARSFYLYRTGGYTADPIIFEIPWAFLGWGRRPPYGFKANMKPRESTSGNFEIPPYIGFLEFYVKEIAALGMLASAGRKMSSDYLDYKFDRIRSFLVRLLEAAAGCVKGGADEDVYYLAIKQATDNLCKLEKLLMGHNDYEIRFRNKVNWDAYKELIVKRVEQIDEKKRCGYYNMEAFWNGFVNDDLSPMIRG